GEVIGDPEFLGDLINSLQLVRGGFVRPEDAEVRHIFLHYLAKEIAERGDILGFKRSGLIYLHRVIAEVRDTQRSPNTPAIGMGIRAHAAVASWRQRPELRNKLAIGVKQLLWLLLPHPLFKHAELIRIFLDIGQGHLVCAPETLQ